MQDRQKLLLIAAAAVGAFFLLRPGTAAAGELPGTKPGGSAFAPSNTGSLLSRLVGSTAPASSAPSPLSGFASAAAALFNNVMPHSPSAAPGPVLDNGTTTAPAAAPAALVAPWSLPWTQIDGGSGGDGGASGGDGGGSSE